mgnify:CR=1 FL=1
MVSTLLGEDPAGDSAPHFLLCLWPARHISALDFKPNMNGTVKKALWIGGWVLSVFVAFVGGLWTAAYFLGGIQSSNYLVRELAEAVQTQHALEYLDSGATNQARGSLNLRMDATS